MQTSQEISAKSGNEFAAVPRVSALAPSSGGTIAGIADYKIIRRNGAVVNFEPSKISIAMTKAFLAVNGGQGAASARVRELVLGGVTDVYQPIDKHYGLTRQLLTVLHELKHPVGLVTKGALIERDLDLLAQMSQWQGVAVYITLTTLDAELARRLEPRAASPAKRLSLMRRLSEAGVRVGVSVSPQIPFINVDLEQCLAAAREAGARNAFYTVLRLPLELETVFQDWLLTHYPERAERVMNRVRDLHGGRNYRSEFGLRHTGQGVWAQLLAQRFAKACARLGLVRESTPLNTDLFVGRAQAVAPATAQQAHLDF